MHGEVDGASAITRTDKLRAFFAVDLDARTRGVVARLAAALRDSPEGQGARWVRAETLHVTLRFLGEVEPGRVAPLVANVRAQTAGLAPFRLELGGVRAFPSKRRPIAIVMDVGPAEPLAQLAEAVEQGVIASGFAPESRPFRAHLTLARVRDRRRLPTVTGTVTAVGEGCHVTEVVLFRSDFHRSGARYSPVGRVPLGLGHEHEGSPLIT